jgi:hypothetical protein
MLSTRLVDVASSWLERRVSRRSFLRRTAVVGSAVAVSGFDYVLRPGTAYASVCGTGSLCRSGWTAMCCTVNSGVNRCPPGSFAGGWWKADGASLCGGHARYYIDCQARCRCGCGSGAYFCGSGCWNCRSHCASGSCDKRRVCTNVFRYGQCHQEIDCSGPVWCRAISCTPPWKWESCTKSSATDNHTVTHSAPCLPNGWTAIMQRYTALGSQGSVLGTTIGGEQDGRVGRVQRYEHGRMWWSIDTDAHWLIGYIAEHYVQLGGSWSPLGLPTTDVRVAFDGKGHYAHFQHGSIYRAADGNPYGVWAEVGAKYAAMGYAWSLLGYPTTDRQVAFDGTGHFAHFEHGSIYAGPGLDACAVWGPIHDAWAADGYAHSSHGYPVSDVEDVPEGQSCEFEHDVATYDSSTGQVTWTPK